MFRKATQEEMKPNRLGAPSKWPLHLMEVGDLLECNQGEFGKTPVSVYPHVFGRSRGWKFSVHKNDKGSYNIVRLS